MTGAVTGERTTLTGRIQAGLTRYYGIDDAPDVDDFVRPVDGGAREELVVRQLEGSIEVELVLPRAALDGGPMTLDLVCQIVEGVSHFVYLAERARRELPATQLELEIQAEVDKYVFFALAPAANGQGRAFEAPRAAAIRSRLYDRVVFFHPAGTESGDRYRMANGIAARFAQRIEAKLARRGRFSELRDALRRFYGAGQTEKIELARVA